MIINDMLSSCISVQRCQSQCIMLEARDRHTLPACGQGLSAELLQTSLRSTLYMAIATAFLWQQPLALLQAQPGLPPAFLAPVHRQFLLAGQQLRILDHHSSARALVQRMATLAGTEAAEARAAARAAGDDWAGVPTAGAGLVVQSAGWWLLLLRAKVQGGAG